MLEEMDIYIENDMALSVARTRELQSYSSASDCRETWLCVKHKPGFFHI